MYQFQTSMALMKNRKAAQVLGGQTSFDALQTSDGHALFFSVGETQIFYLSAEQENVKTGWTPIDLTTELGSNFPNKTVTSRAFAVSQDISSGNILIAQAVHVAEDNADYLFLLLNLSNAPDAAWLQSASNRSWIARPYDDTTHPLSAVNVSYINITPNQNPTSAPYIVVGVQNATTSYIQNYTVNINPDATSGVWNQFTTSENYDQLLGMRVGKPQLSAFSGLYELYTLGGQTSLTFTPLQAYYKNPLVIKLTPPPGASAIATLPVDATGHTYLYVAAPGSIYLYTPEAQTSFATGMQIISSDLITTAKSLEVHISGEQVVLWGLNESGQVFYSRCLQSAQTDPASWSAPVFIQQGADQMASMLNLQTQSSVLYAHVGGQQLIKLTQDPVTTQWRSQSILLPHLDVNDFVEFYTFTTQINVIDENNMPLPNTTFVLSATSPCTMYMDDAYLTISNADQLSVCSDAAGTITLVQETTTLGAVCYNLVQSDGSIVNVNPMSGPIQKVGGISDGATLANVTVTDENGNASSLVPSTVPSTQKEAVAQALVQFVSISNNVPSDGSVQSGAAGRPRRTVFDPQLDSTWGVSFANNDIQFFEGANAPNDIQDALDAFAGDIYKWIQEAAQVEQFVVQTIDGISQAFFTIAGKIYRFTVRCMNDVVQGIQFILQQIEVTFDSLVQWLGFVFSWNDIVRTHDVLSNIFTRYVDFAINNISTYKTDLANIFETVEQTFNDWAKLPAVVPSTISGICASSTPSIAQQSPGANWGVYQVKSNINGANSSYSASMGQGSSLETLLNEVYGLIQSEAATFTNAYQDIKTQIIDQLTTLTVTELIEKIVTLVFDVFLESAKNVILGIIDCLQALVEGASEVLTQPIDVPVISSLYSEKVGRTLTLLDLVCLVMAIPVTVTYKAATNEAPFPNNEFTTNLIDAPDFTTIQNLYANSPAATRNGLPTAAPSASVVDVLTFVSGICGFFGAAFLIPICQAKFANSSSDLLGALYFLAYLPYVAPDISPTIVDFANQSWDVKMNEIITGIDVVKAYIDIGLCLDNKDNPAQNAVLTAWAQVSPLLEGYINLAWQVPVTAGLIDDMMQNNWIPDAAAVAGFLAGTSFDIGGGLSMGTSDRVCPDLKVREGFLAEMLAFTGICGVLDLIWGVLSLPGAGREQKPPGYAKKVRQVGVRTPEMVGVQAR